MDNQFIKLADLPPDPMDTDALLHYKDVGFNVCLLTEDDVKTSLTKLGTTLFEADCDSVKVEVSGQVFLRHPRRRVLSRTGGARPHGVG